MRHRNYNHKRFFFRCGRSMIAPTLSFPNFITHSMITQIGRENNLSAEICKCPYKSLVSTFILSNSPLRTTEKTSMGL